MDIFSDKIIGRISRIITAVVLALAAILLFVMVNQFIDRISRHEAQWLDQGFRHASEMASEKPSEKD